MLIEYLLLRFPVNFSKWLLGGDRKSASQVESSRICNFLKSLSLIVEGIFLLFAPSTKKISNHLSRKFFIMVTM